LGENEELSAENFSISCRKKKLNYKEKSQEPQYTEIQYFLLNKKKEKG